MPTYLYGLILTRNAALVPSDVRGLDGSAVRVVDCGHLAAIASSIDRAPTRALPHVRAHDAVLRRVVERGPTVAAVRFGQHFATDDALRSEVGARASAVRPVLEKCDGCVEMRLLLPADHRAERRAARSPETAHAGKGRAYLEQIKLHRDRLARLTLRPALGALVRDERIEEVPAVPPQPGRSDATGGRPTGRGADAQVVGAIVYAHLVDREREAEYREAVLAQPSLSGVTVVGPLALHTFAEPALD